MLNCSMTTIKVNASDYYAHGRLRGALRDGLTAEARA
jgi:hypothetical protein